MTGKLTALYWWWDFPHKEASELQTVKEYNVHLDSKKRITLRGARYPYYNVKEYENGCIILEPRELTVPKDISSRTLRDMDEAVKNFKAGKVSEPVDLSDF